MNTSTTTTDLPLNTAIVAITVVALVCLAWPKGVFFKSRLGHVFDSRPPTDKQDEA